ncbi:MAG TPA: histone deacetylase [Longimicrobiales bacterium]|nr:histone deacetylase [Longimicrobiales bacterium]
MKIYYADHFVLPLPTGHRFPMQKYALLRERVAARLPGAELLVPEAATNDELLRVHTADYLHRVVTGTLDPPEVRRIGFPWSAAMVERSRRSVGATIAASRAALIDGAGANLAGGTHHAFSDHGEGFCVFNDVAVAFRAMQAEGRARRCAIVDCDVHQGNGTASILNGDDTAFTFSVHGANNFPFRKVNGSLDIALPDGAADDEYLAAVRRGVNAAMEAAPDIVYYVAGADPYEGDRLGRLSVSMAGLRGRDRIVTAACRTSGVPLVLVMGGGYCGVVEETVAIHAGSVMEVSRLVPRP